MTAPALWLVTGPRGAGKTLFCRRVAEHARAAGWEAAGLLSPALFENGIKTGILAEDLRTGSTRPLASAVSRLPFDLQLGRWFFDRSAIEWGNLVIKTSLPSDLFLVDELGPLELLHAAGWASALPALREAAYRLGLVVVRPELLENARAALPVAGTIHLDRPCNPEALRWWKQFSGCLASQPE